MKNKKTIVGILLLIILVVGGIITVNSNLLRQNNYKQLSQKKVEEKITEDEVVEKGLSNVAPLFRGDFKNFLYCPDGASYLFTDAKGSKLYLKNDQAEEPIKIIEQKGIGNNLGWSKNCNSIFFREKTKDYKIFVNSITVDSKKKLKQNQINPAAELSTLVYSDTAYCLDQKTLAVYGEYEDKKWKITQEDGNHYKILLAPDNKKLLVHKGANVYLYTTSGELIANLGRGIATCWSSDSKYCIGFIDESVDGHQLTGAELLLFDIDEKTRTVITATKNIYEMWPAWHPKKNEVIFFDYKNQTTYRADIQV